MINSENENKETDGRNGAIYTCPYRNLVRAIFERLQNDLTAEVITDIFPHKKSKGADYIRLERGKAYLFFFDEGSSYYAGFRQWCELAEFDNLYWRKKALTAVALKCLRAPRFRTAVVTKCVRPKVLDEIDAMAAKIAAWDEVVQARG